MKHKFGMAVFLLLSLLISGSLLAQDNTTKVNDLKRNPKPNEIVTIKGTVSQRNEDPAVSTRFYLLKDYWGGIIKVRTASAYPEVGEHYKVTGIVDVDHRYNEVFITEQSRVPLKTPHPPPKKDWIVWVLVIVAVVLVLAIVGGLVIYFQGEQIRALKKAPVTPVKGQTVSFQKPSGKTIEWQTGQDKPKPPSKETIVVYPGRFLVEGDPSVNEIRVYHEETIIGRPEPPDRDDVPKLRFIAFHDGTISRWQPEENKYGHAKLFFKNETYSIMNLSTTNPVTVNGEKLGGDEVRTLKPGDKIGLARINLTYQAD